jgi:hypothetical protein
MNVTGVVFGVSVSVARAVLDIETAGDFDLLHVFPRRHRDARKLLDRPVLRRRGLDQVDPDRALRQPGGVLDIRFLERGLGGNKHRKHADSGSCGLGFWDLTQFGPTLEGGAC